MWCKTERGEGLVCIEDASGKGVGRVWGPDWEETDTGKAMVWEGLLFEYPS